MKLTAVFEPAKEGAYTCFVEEIPAAISQGETVEEAKANLLDALKLVLECQCELAEKELSPQALRETIEFAGGVGGASPEQPLCLPPPRWRSRHLVVSRLCTNVSWTDNDSLGASYWSTCSAITG